jgi:hypothetical protein
VQGAETAASRRCAREVTPLSFDINDPRHRIAAQREAELARIRREDPVHWTRRTGSGCSRGTRTVRAASKQHELFLLAAQGAVQRSPSLLDARRSTGPSTGASAGSASKGSRRAWCGGCARPHTPRSTRASTRSRRRVAASS